MGNPSYLPLAMFRVLLLQRWYNLSDQGMDDTLADRISFRRFTGMSFDYATLDYTTICRFREAHRNDQVPGRTNSDERRPKLSFEERLGIAVDR